MKKNFLPYLLSLFALSVAYLTSGCGGEPKYHISMHLTTNTNVGHLLARDVKMEMSQLVVTIENAPLFFEGDIVDVDLVKVDIGLAVMFKLTRRSAEVLARTSMANPGKAIITLINGKAAGMRRIDEVMNQGMLLTFLEVDPKELPDFVLELKQSVHQTQKEKRTKSWGVIN